MLTLQCIRYNTSRVVTLSVPALVAAAAAGAEQAQAATVTVRMINATCANPKALWLGKTMNSVMWPSAAQVIPVAVCCIFLMLVRVF